LLIYTGCQDLKEDPKALLSPSSYFQSQKNLDAAVAGIYGVLNIDHGIGGVSFMVSAFGADDLSAHPASNKAEMRDFDRLAGTSDNPRIQANWAMYYMAIANANNVLVNYENVVSDNESLKQYAAAQAYFFRAWCYFRLVKEFGSAPLILEPATTELKPSLAPATDIYNQVVSDLKMALSLFPTNITISADKANPLSTKTLLADVYLNMAGWPLNQTDKYALAASTANEVIQSGKYSLVDDYATVFTTNDNSEAIFTIKFDLVNKPTRNRGSFSMNEAEQPLSGPSGWHDFTTESNFYKNAPKCKRSWQTFSDTLYIQNADKTYTLKPWNTVGTKQVMYKKFRYGLGVPGKGDGGSETKTALLSGSPSSGKDNDIFRYPMVLLDFAEASAMANNAVSSACYDAINLVRHRAGLSDLKTAPSATAFRDSVVHERAYEFAGEYGIRWMDIQRLQLLPKIISERNPNETVTLNATSASNPASYYLAPIPLSEITLNPTWTQNTGY
jgi:tetratricopeptide (TPR) repeat protein